MNVFWKRGFPSVSTSDLAEAMSIRRSSFYNSFGNREAVFREAVQRYGRQAPDAVLDEVRPEQAVVPVIVTMFREICRVRSADRQAKGCLVCNSIAELVGANRKLGPVVARAVTDRMAVIERLWQQAVRRGEIHASADPATAAAVIVTFMTGLNTISKVVRDEATLWGMCRKFLSDLLGIPPDAVEAIGGEASRPPFSHEPSHRPQSMEKAGDDEHVKVRRHDDAV